MARRPHIARAALAAVLVVGLVAACSTPASAPPSSSATTEPSSSLPAASAQPSASAAATIGPPTGPGPGRIVFARFTPARNLYGLFTVNADGSDLKELLPGWTYALQLPRWSWQGDLILARATSTSTIIPVDAAKHIHLYPSAGPGILCAAWSPDGGTLACEGWSPKVPGREGVYTIPSSVGNLDPFTVEAIRIGAPKRLTTPPSGVHDVPGDYSNDGRIAFVRMSYAVLGLGEIWIANADGSNAHKITDTLSTKRISWSRDGRWIVGERDGVLELFDLQNLTVDPQRISLPGGKASEPRFAPDDSRIVFVFTKTGSKTTSIESIGLDGSDLQVITSGQLDVSPDWGAPGF
jgi:WD40-like Beta Propeller Repeat